MNAELLRRMQKNRTPCVLCGSPQIHATGVYIPNRQALVILATPKNIEAVALYTLCRDCHDLPDIENIVERAIYAAVAKRN